MKGYLFLMLCATFPMGAAVLSPSARLAATAETRSDARLSAYITVDSESLDMPALDALCVNCVRVSPETVTAIVDPAALSAIARVEGVKYVEAAAPVMPMLDKAVPEVGADRVRSGEDLPSPFTGKGVVVGVVDAGFDYGHAAFRDSDGNLRIARVWEQSSSGTPPEKYGYGLEMSEPDVIYAAAGDIVNNSHGTHVAAIAAGSDSVLDGALMGAAPDAEIVLVSMGESSADNVNISNAIAYIFDYAEERGLPAVVNLSLGNHAGPHDGTSTFDRVVDGLQGPGRLVVGSSGNHGADSFHVRKRFSQADMAPLRTFIDFRKAVTYGGDIEVWAENDVEVYAIAYNLNTASDVERVKIYPMEEDLTTVSLGRNVTGDLSVAGEVNPVNGKRHVLVSTNLGSVRSGYAVALEVSPLAEGGVDVWADNVYLGLTSRGMEGFADAQLKLGTIAEIGGTANRILTVGSYTTRPEYVLYNETEVREVAGETLGALSLFSSCGPTADERVKPDVTAPGCFISSAVSNNDGSGTLLVSFSHQANGRENMYGYMQGTSMSAPMVAGVVATWLQAYPGLTPEQLKQCVSVASRRDACVEGELPSYLWGYGKIDAYEGLRQVLEISGIEGPVAESCGLSWLRVRRGSLEVLPLAHAQSAELSLFALDGRQVATYSLGALRPGESRAVDTSALPSGAYIVRLVADSRLLPPAKFIK